jgi:hypothetical protein
MKNYIKKSLVVFSVLILAGCGASLNKIIKEEPVKIIPDKKYETIIRLKIWENNALQPEAGFVYVVPGGKVTTDFPREEVVKNIHMLDKYAQRNRNNMRKYVIKDSKGKVRGYYELVPEYTATIWERGDDILLQIIIPNNKGLNSDGFGDDRRSGGRHGGR